MNPIGPVLTLLLQLLTVLGLLLVADRWLHRHLQGVMFLLTGDEELVRTIGKDYYIYFERVTLGTATAAGVNYTVDHTTYSYLIDADGRLRVIYPFQAPTQMIADDIKSLL